MTDTHSHLNDERFSEDLAEVIERAFAEGVRRINVVGYSVESSERAVEIAEAYHGVFAVVGLHPYEAERYTPSSLRSLERLLDHPKVVAVGEIGLDYYRGPEDRESQKRLFREQIEIALRNSLPVVLHVRDAFQDVVEIVGGFPEGKFLFHSFSGSPDDMDVILTHENWYVSFSGMITFLENVRKAAEKAPRDRTVVETDAPYLAPVPKRGKRNEPAFVKYTLRELARVWGVGVVEAEGMTDGNAESFFRYGE